MDLKEIVKNTEQCLIDNSSEWQDLWDGYADTIENKCKRIIQFRKTFNEWKPLRIHMSVNDIINNDNKFSIRFEGYEVAKMVVDNDMKPFLKISSEKEGFNRENYSIKLKSGEYEWQSKEAKEFRNHFKSHIKLDSSERSLESLILDEMEKNIRRDKFLGSLHNIQQVKIFKKLRFQMPTPLSSNTGSPVYRKGNIDILSRIKKNGNTHLGIIELKKDDRKSSTYKHAVAQSIIYSICIRYILRVNKTGEKWWRLFGFDRKLPKELTIFSVAMIPENLSAFYNNEIDELKLKDINNCINIEQDKIKCGYIFFEKTKENRIQVKDMDL